MTKLRWAFLVACAALSGCVLGYGRCLLLSPMRTTLAGTLDFHAYEVGGVVERVAVLTTDHSQYVYAPAENDQCQLAERFQLTGWGEYPPDLRNGTRVRVSGSLAVATSPHQHTHFVLRVRSIDTVPTLGKPAPAH
ncbi:MAG: hypothetical protein KGL36_04245 [Gammaproteobacteria bacterium]|nr:hypothetical protein [Gammaproteobacteria bacterium]